MDSFLLVASTVGFLAFLAWRRRSPRPFPPWMTPLLHSPLRKRGFSPDAAAERHGVTPGMIAYYFGSKSGLYEAMLDATYQQLVERMRQALERPSTDGDPIARLVEDAFLKFDSLRYRLHAWTVMPNHVHVLFTVMPDAPLGEVVSSWKRFTGRQANRQIGR